jgi:hypothetical protein
MAILNVRIAGARPVVCRASSRIVSFGSFAAANPALIAKPALAAPLRQAARCAPRLPQRAVQTPAATASPTGSTAPQGKLYIAQLI